MAAILDIANFGAALLVMSVAAAASLSAKNLIRRSVAAFVALLGAVLAVSALHAERGLLMTGAALAAAYAVVSVALLVRVQENYRSVEADELDGADLEDEPPEPRA